MCFAIPGKVVEIRGEDAVVDYSGERREVKNFLGAEVGEWVVVSNKVVVMKVPESQADAYIDSIKNAGKNVNKQ